MIRAQSDYWLRYLNSWKVHFLALILPALILYDFQDGGGIACLAGIVVDRSNAVDY